MITINNLKVSFKNNLALDIDEKIEIGNGERIGIIGENGAGKSTLINAILGLVNYQGTIRRNLNDIGVHLQFNEYSENLSLKLMMETILNTSVNKDSKLIELLEYFDMKEHINKKYNQLSGGEKQKFTLIMVLYQDKPMTIFDEVTTGLDFISRENLMKKIKAWYYNKNSTFCIVSHYYSELDQLVDKILYLDKGHLITYGKKDELFRKYCGDNVYIIQKDDYLESLSIFNQIKSTDDTIAFSTTSIENQKELVSKFIENNIDFRRSSNDIELLTINAKYKYYGGTYEE